MSFNGENFNGADLTAVFGGVECDLRGAIFDGDKTLRNSDFRRCGHHRSRKRKGCYQYNGYFRGAEDKRHLKSEGQYTLYITATAVFGGVDVKNIIREKIMLNIQHLTKTYGEKRAVDNLSIHIAPGEIYGFIGHNGAGKTTTLKAVAGILSFDGGEIFIDGKSIKTDPPDVKNRWPISRTIPTFTNI